VAFNTWQAGVGGDTKMNTDTFDKEIKEYLFQNIFLLFKN
jgi:hypothetical protein